MSDASVKTLWFAQLMCVLVASQATVIAARTMTSYRALELGAGGLIIGLLAASFAVVPLFVAVAVGRAVDGERARDVLRLGMLLSLAGAVVLAAAGSLWQLFIGTVLSGLGVLVATVALQGVLARKVADAGHDRAFGLFTVAGSLGQLLGPLLATLAARVAADPATGAEARAGLAATALIAFIGLVLVVRLPDLREEQRHRCETPGEDEGEGKGEGERTKVLAMVRTPGMMPAIFASLAVLSAVDLITAFLPVLAEERGIPVVAVGLLLALRGVASMASRLMLGRLVALLGRQRLLVGSMSLGALSLAAVPLAHTVPSLAVLMCVAGFLLGIGQPLTMSWVTSLVPRHSRATALAVRLMGNRVGQVLVPAGAGLVAASAGASGVFLVVAGLLGVAGGSLTLTSRRRGRVSGRT